MEDRELGDINDRLGGLAKFTPRVRKGLVTATSPFSVTIGGASVPYTSIKRLSSYAPTIGDDVLVLTWQQDMLVLGKIV